MSEPPVRLSLPSGEFLVLDSAAIERLRAPERRVLVDSRNGPALTAARAEALRKVERYRWWSASAQFPGLPDEVQQLNALVDWFVSFALVSVILLAPGVGASVTMLLRRYAIPITQTVSLSVAVISLLLLILLMQRFAPALWGARGDPGGVLRRLLLLSLPTPVIAAVATLLRPSERIETLGLGFLTAQIILLGLLVIWFLYYYFDYTGQTEAVRRLDNATPREAILAFYDLLRPCAAAAERREKLEEAVQYLASFRRSRHIPPPEGAGEEEPGRWRGPSEERARTLSELAWDLSRLTADLRVGNQDQEFDIAGAAVLSSAEGGEITACCVLRTRGVAGLEAGAAAVAGEVDRAHRMSRFEDGWFVEDAPGALTREDLTGLRNAGWISAVKAGA
jgi:hypothetical protein